MRTVNCTEEELYAAVEAVGKNLSDIRAYREKLATGQVADAWRVDSQTRNYSDPSLPSLTARVRMAHFTGFFPEKIAFDTKNAALPNPESQSF